MGARIHGSPALHHRSPAQGWTLVAEGPTGLVAGRPNYAFATASSPSGTAGLAASCVLLDNQSTVSVFRDRSLLLDVHQVRQGVDIHSHGSVRHTNWMGRLPGFGSVWLNEGGMANILSMRSVREQYRVAYDGTADEFVVYTDTERLTFALSSQGLYCRDMGSLSTP